MKVSTATIAILLMIGFLGGLLAYYHIPVSYLAQLSFYEDLANPSTRIVYIQAGYRKEQVANILAEDLGWNSSEKEEFQNAPIALGKTTLEGYYFPTTYLVSKDTTPLDMTKTMLNEFNKQVATVPKTKKTAVVNQDTILKIASIIQREAAGPSDMKLISGIIWNRLFAGMKLQMDATLQYAAGTPDNWWPQVTPADKNIPSPYNTYIYAGPPPTPIASPSLAAIIAAYNPQTTSCLYYIHDKNRKIHCSATYQGQLNNIAKYF